MKIDEVYSIENDESNFKLVETRIKGEKSKDAGDIRIVVLGYYGYLDAALKGYMKYALRHDLPEDSKLVLEKLGEIENKIESFCTKIGVFKGTSIDLELVAKKFGD
jgi:hypothetical protein